MTARLLRYVLTVLAAVVFVSPGAGAQEDGKKPDGAATPAPYDTFVKDAQVSNGLITVVRKAGKIYLAIPKSQLGADFIETSVPQTGLGGFGPAPGEPYVAPARVMRFERVDDRIVIRWPNTFARVDPNTPRAIGAGESLPASVVAVTPIVAESANAVVIGTTPFLDDVANLKAQFDAVASKPGHSYKLDPDRSFFTEAKAFPQNTILRVSQTWSTDSPDTIDNAPDPRSIEVKMTYNFIAAPADGYMARIGDPRVGYFEQPLLDFQHDANPTRNVYYISRWNFRPATPGQPSQAGNPLVFTLSDDIPPEYRDSVRDALLKWNDAFTRIGILGAVQVQQQPTDGSFDPDDIRHNMVRWFDASQPQYGAEALIVTDPRTGEEINAGINIDSVMGLQGRTYRYVIAPARNLPDSEALEQEYVKQSLYAVTLHESGHDLGLQHNFIGSMAYSAKQVQDRTFTSKYGIVSSVMEYTPVNLWPRGTPNGDYNQMVLGPYDYYAVKWGYEYVPGATTPEAEKPALNALASRWSDPMYRFASDEDTDFETGHAIDPRVQTDDLTDNPLAWERTTLAMLHSIMNGVANRFPKNGEPYEEARRAFERPLALYVRTSVMPAHVIGGEYLSRAAAGDPHSKPPLQPVSRADEYAAWQLLQTWLFSDAAWRFAPAVLDRLAYSEVSWLGTNGTWIYNPGDRHDVPIVEIASRTQERVMDELFAPLTLTRIDDLSTKYAAGSTMTLSDLFDWTRNGMYGDLASGAVAKAGVVRRNAQMHFAKRLAQLWVSPSDGTPTDAQSLARLQLEMLAHDCALGLLHSLDEQTRAHLEALQAVAKQALEARATIAR
ncbi:MAG: zinc-dependent metalloprotease [Candidatus Eremiobacteraeota bacterium]|nr:zinc-dependent metalloprotease [Candidatus Eremiobacteraeota bacterium]